MIDPIRIEFDVACSAEHAFDTWTARIADWWPTRHSVTGRPDIEVVLEGWQGGRIFERVPDAGNGSVPTGNPGATGMWAAGRASCRTIEMRLPGPEPDAEGA